MKTASLAQVKNQLSWFLREAARQSIVITKHGRPAGVLIGFESENDRFDHCLENDPRFLRRIARARVSLRAGEGVPWEYVQSEIAEQAVMRDSSRRILRERRLR
jgi:prevent-host-death family protein